MGGRMEGRQDVKTTFEKAGFFMYCKKALTPPPPSAA
jgi:hypothetical protein